jgi:hypothetical protein
MKPKHSKILRRRAFEYQELAIWMARNSHRLINIHDADYYYRNMAFMVNPSEYIINEWYDGSYDEFILDTEKCWPTDIRLVRSCYRF